MFSGESKGNIGKKTVKSRFKKLFSVYDMVNFFPWLVEFFPYCVEISTRNNNGLVEGLHFVRIVTELMFSM